MRYRTRALRSIAATDELVEVEPVAEHLQEAEFLLLDMEVGRRHLDGERVGGLVEPRRQRCGDDVEHACRGRHRPGADRRRPRPRRPGARGRSRRRPAASARCRRSSSVRGRSWSGRRPTASPSRRSARRARGTVFIVLFMASEPRVCCVRNLWPWPSRRQASVAAALTRGLPGFLGSAPHSRNG